MSPMRATRHLRWIRQTPVGHLHVRDLDDDLHRAVRIEAIERDESVKAFVTRALERELERSRKKRGADPRRTR